MKTALALLTRKNALASLLGPAMALAPYALSAQPVLNPFTGKPMEVAPAPAQPGPAVPAPSLAPPTMPLPVQRSMSGTTPPGAALGGPAAGTDTPLQNTPNPGVTLKFDNADIYDVIQVVLGDILKLDYVIDPAVQGRITIKSTGAISMADIYSTLETALATSNISIVRQGKIYKVSRDANTVRDTVSALGTGPSSPVMQIIPLKFVQANQLVNTLRNFVSAQAAITNDPANKHLIVVDRAANVEKIVDMVKALDTDYFSKVQVRLVALAHSEAAEVAKELEGLFKTSGIFNWTGTDATKAYFLPITRMNALLVATSNDKVMDAAAQWIKALDAEPRNGLGSYVHVYPVANGNAVQLANLITQIFGGQAAGYSGETGASTLPSANSSSFGAAGSGGGTGGTSMGAAGTANAGVGDSRRQANTRTIERGSVPTQGTAGTGTGLSGSVQVIADEGSNTLIVRASPQDFQQVKKVLERLDNAPRQVMVQVLVAEVALSDTLQYGVEWWLKSNLSANGRSWPAFLGLDGAIKSPVATATTTPPVTGTSSGLNYAVFGSAGQVIGLLNLLGQDTDVNVLSTPHVLASDGKIARIEVGNEIPVVTQTVSTPTTGLGTGTTFSTSNSIQYRPTGILLEVKPSITASGRLTLSISQEVSSIGPNIDAGGSNYPSFQKRKVTTDATLEDGKTIMLAGLIQDEGTAGATGIPGLKDVPVFGGLFGTTRNVRKKNELLITITPYIVKNKEESDQLAVTFQDSLRTLGSLLQRNATTPDLRRDAPPVHMPAVRAMPTPEPHPSMLN